MKEHVGCGCFPPRRYYPGIAHLMRVRARGVVADIDPETPWEDLEIALIDTETTGRDPAMGDRIVEVGIVVGRRGEIVRRHNWLVNPGMPIPTEAREVHGISDDDVKDAPTFEAVAAEIVEALRGTVPAAYNALFDRSFVRAELARAGVDTLPPNLASDVVWLDPLVWAREIQKYEKSKRLSEVASRLGISLENAHRASDDAEAALRVLFAFASDPRVPRAYGALVHEQSRLSRTQEADFQDFRRRNPRS